MQTFNKIIALSGQFSAAFTRFTGKILRIFAKRKPAWIGCGIFILFALIWLFGLITSQSRLQLLLGRRLVHHVDWLRRPAQAGPAAREKEGCYRT
ncbi:hypothetical protein FEZ35_09350 [Lactobacillus delbrueckii subsp. bulgaricus]|uniref:Uncharacterized protein n=1 Tax=Lactobacillus delbrueckii subsp. lactis TaxID=29397 RepID=A0A3G6JHB2_LACDL|nr:MAG: hypothetical protein DQL93_07020 [Lactobacillus delbrueckii subsp. lactis]TLQ32336.1 hypothetical protein FEZ35_09350 [Lactobacillus delbrueckii subsp. bulgaricus]AZA26217.1 MAG: hypothetical protein DF199_04580 [Lactobacillus delbrueckii subsp. lactis]MCS8607563.1 hypothetical protein [Lactobacillus delbrueckii subsp. lactis]MCT3462219.1 hypothetical protein [Lactobacillus delbrueckii subsp. lactis]